MTTGWLLLLLVVVSSQSVDSQSTTDDETCTDGGVLASQLQREVQELRHNQQETLQQLQAVLNRLDNIQLLVARPRDCSEASGSSNGVYTVYINGSPHRPVEVYCDMTTTKGGWTVFQRRQDGNENFYRNWTDYATGFGNLRGEFWLGNDNIHELTSGKNYVLRVDLADFSGNSRYAEYSNFTLGSASEKYNLTSLGTYSGNAGDSLRRHLGHKFSTRDQDNDVWSSISCAVERQGAWWYSNCANSNLNGLYLRGGYSGDRRGVYWYHWKGHWYSLRLTEMKIRPYGL